MKKKNSAISIYELCLYPMLGALMFCSKVIMEALPNIHLLGMLTVAYTVALRRRALIPIYIYVFLNGLYAGFNAWWVPYLYIWTVLWGAAMLLPKRMKRPVAVVVYAVVCALHGFLFGALYAPAQALMYGFTFKQTLAWISAGLTFDIIHSASNLFVGFLILPMSDLLSRLMRGGKHN